MADLAPAFQAIYIYILPEWEHFLVGKKVVLSGDKATIYKSAAVTIATLTETSVDTTHYSSGFMHQSHYRCSYIMQAVISMCWWNDNNLIYSPSICHAFHRLFMHASTLAYNNIACSDITYH